MPKARGVAIMMMGRGKERWRTCDLYVSLTVTLAFLSKLNAVPIGARWLPPGASPIVAQKIFSEAPSTIPASFVKSGADDVDDFLDSVGDQTCFGFAARYDPVQRITYLALSSDTRALILQFNKKDPTRNFVYSEGHARTSALLSSWHTKCSFSTPRIALALHQCNWIPLTNALSLSSHTPLRHSLRTLSVNDINDRELRFLFTRPPHTMREYYNHLALEAWTACHLALPIHEKLTRDLGNISTDNFSHDQLNLLAKLHHDQALRHFWKTADVGHDEDVSKLESGATIWERLRTKEIVQPRAHRLRFERTRRLWPAGTNAQSIPDGTIANILKGRFLVFNNPFFQRIFVPNSRISWRDTPDIRTDDEKELTAEVAQRALNDTQQVALRAILSPSNDHRVVTIQAPPGSGIRTLVAAVTMIEANAEQRNIVWIVASLRELMDMSLVLDSAGFERYRFITEAHLRMDHGVHRQLVLWKLHRGFPVILCTFRVLRALGGSITFGLAAQTVIVLGANQIDVGAYISPIYQYTETLRKMVLIGDDKQLAPHYQELVPGLESVFGKEHLRSDRIFLDTQYRLPTPIGDVISKHMYEGKLKSVHPITTSDCCTFIDVHGQEELNGRGYYQNTQEAMEVLSIAKRLQEAGRSFKIITSYKTQRELIQQHMEQHGIEWQDKVFTVDAFEGCEDDNIIVSVVRTAGVGFLKDDRRMNVMLTRCRKAMWICASKEFLEGAASETLVGKLAEELGKDRWFKSSQSDEEKL